MCLKWLALKSAFHSMTTRHGTSPEHESYVMCGAKIAGKSALAGFTSSLPEQRRKRIELTTGHRVRGTWPVIAAGAVAGEYMT